MKEKLRNNGLSIVVLAIFAISMVGQTVAGFHQYNNERQDEGQPKIAFSHYFSTGHFWEATFENWESEFLQMSFYVLLTVFLVQRGSSESKNPDCQEEVDREPDPKRKGAPGPVRRGGLALKLYQNSLSLTLFALFLCSFAGHAVGGTKAFNEEQATKGKPTVTIGQFAGSSEFWFQSMQNWQSEFLSMGVLIILSIYLRQKGSPESKPVDAAHSETGE